MTKEKTLSKEICHKSLPLYHAKLTAIKLRPCIGHHDFQEVSVLLGKKMPSSK